MIKNTLILAFIICICAPSFGQKYFTRDGKIVFESDAVIEQIESVNNKVMCVWDTESGAIELAVLISSFKFEKALMEEHFNENYMETEKFPKAIFKGQVNNMSAIDLNTKGAYTAEISGTLTMHGVTNDIDITANVSVEKDGIKGLASFEIAVADYDISIPKVVKDNIAKVVQVMVDLDLKPLNK